MEFASMSFISDSKQALKELSSIFAGMKIALIVVSWIGVGSAAKWIVEHWYPFTRNMWDIVTTKLSLPILDIAIKDGLTALVFFLPLGLTAAIAALLTKKEDISKTLRLVALFFGFIFFFLVSHNSLLSVINAASNSDRLSVVISLSLAVFSFFTGVISSITKTSMMKVLVIGMIITGLLMYGIELYYPPVTGFDTVDRTVIRILLAILFCLVLANIVTPKKLLVTAGSAVTFVIAAFVFEGGVMLKTMIENIS